MKITANNFSSPSDLLLHQEVKSVGLLCFFDKTTERDAVLQLGLGFANLEAFARIFLETGGHVRSLGFPTRKDI